MQKTFVCICLICLEGTCVVKSFSEVITPRSVPDGNLQVNRSWSVYVDSNLAYALMTCFYNRKRKYFNQMRTCLMNCSSSCVKMRLRMRPPCLKPEVLIHEEIHKLIRSLQTYLAFKIVGRYYHRANPCFFRRDLTQYRMDYFVYYV